MTYGRLMVIYVTAFALNPLAITSVCVFLYSEADKNFDNAECDLSSVRK